MAKLTHTVSGNVASFRSADKTNIESLKVRFLPIQEGSGDPYPPGGGKNLFDASVVQRRDGYLLNDNGVEQSTSLSGYTLNRTSVISGVTYTLSGSIVSTTTTFRLYYYNDDTFVSRTDFLDITNMPYTFTVPSGCNGVALQYILEAIDFSTIQIEEGSSATSYAPYSNIRPINGWKGCNTYQTGKNLWNSLAEIKEPEGTAAAATTKRIFTPFTYCIGMAYTNHHYTDMIDSYNISNNSLTVDGYGGYGISYAIPVTPNAQYKISFTVTSGEYYCGANQYDKEGNFLTESGFNNMVLTAKPNAVMAIFVIRNRTRGTPVTITNMQIESGNVATDYEAFKSSNIYPVTFPAGGKNLFNGTYVHGALSGNLSAGFKLTMSQNSDGRVAIIPCVPDTKYAIKKHETSNRFTVAYLSKEPENNDVAYGLVDNSGATSYIATTGETAKYLAVYVSADGTEPKLMVELGNTISDYESYTDTLYGGYVDITTGDLYKEWSTFDISNLTWTYRDTTPAYYFEAVKQLPADIWMPPADPNDNSITPRIISDRFTTYAGAKIYSNKSGDSAIGISWTRPNAHLRIRADSCNGDATALNSLLEGAILYYELAEPVKIATLTPIEIKTFLDNNIIWSNTNSITEVTYEVIDHLNQKRASIPKQRRKVLWNQIDGPIDSDNWKPYVTDRLTTSFSDGIANIEVLTKEYGGYSVSLRNNPYPNVIKEHIYYASYMVNSEYSGRFGLEFAGGYQASGIYNVMAGEWQRCAFLATASQSRSGAKYMPFPTKQDYPSDVNPKFKVKCPIYVDLTRMFGAGNEPTLEEFEALCKLNHINLEEYHSQDLNGTEQIWYIDDNDKNQYITVNWNQQAKAINTTNYKAYNSSHISIDITDGIITSTWLEDGSEYSWATCANYSKTHSLNSYYYLGYEYYTDIEGYIGGDVGGVTTPYIATQTNQWTRYSALVKRTIEGNMQNYTLYVNRFSKTAPVSAGKICKARNLIAIDITAMFGAGNEPTTAAEFEQMCQYNNINLNSQLDYNATGTPMIWRIK